MPIVQEATAIREPIVANPPDVDARIAELRDASDRPEGRELIRREILKGTIRVAPGPGQGLTILPTTLLWAEVRDPSPPALPA